MGLFRDDLVLRTLWSPEKVREAVIKETKEASLLALDFPGRAGDVREFRGEVKERAFRIIRRVQWRNSFTPVVEGHVVEVPGGSELKLSLFVHPVMLLFVIGWTAIAAASIFMMTQELAVMAPDDRLMYVPVTLLPAGVFFAWVGYRIEVPRIERFFKQLLPPWFDPATLAPASAPPARDSDSSS